MRAKFNSRKPPVAKSARSPQTAVLRHGLARVLSKAGLCSRTEAARWIAAGRVTVDGRVVRDPEFPIVQGRHRVHVDGAPLQAQTFRYLMLNKPRGLVTSTGDERGRDTVYNCFEGSGLPWIAPVGRLDKASEGLLLFSNDPAWAARVNDPDVGPDKTYHVQIDAIPDPALLARIRAGVEDDGQFLSAQAITLLRAGEKNAWVEVVLEEGRNRQIRRLMQAFGIGVLRLIRVRVGNVPLGELPKGGWRDLTPAEASALIAGSS